MNIKSRTRILMVIIAGFLLPGLLSFCSCLSPEYKIAIEEMKEGTPTSPPKTILEIYSRDGGDANIRVQLLRDNFPQGSGEATVHFSPSETKRVEIPLKLRLLTGPVRTTGVEYNKIRIYINDEMVSWKWKG